MNFDTHKTALLAWYVTLHADPAWREQARYQVKQLAKDFPTLYGDLPQMLAQAVRLSLIPSEPTTGPLPRATRT